MPLDEYACGIRHDSPCGICPNQRQMRQINDMNAIEAFPVWHLSKSTPNAPNQRYECHWTNTRVVFAMIPRVAFVGYECA